MKVVMKDIVKDYYMPLFKTTMFTPCDASPGKYPIVGQTLKINEDIGSGYYWFYNNGKGYNIKIHDFSFKNDFVMNMAIPECLSITWYDSIAGEELNPYRPLRAKVAKSFLGGYEPFRATIHKNIPVQAIGIEYEPLYYEKFLKEHYGSDYQTPTEAFRSIDETPYFPEIAILMNQIKNYSGEGVSAELFFDAKAAEALALVFERHRKLNEKKKIVLHPDDIKMLNNLESYINDHYANSLNNEMLAQIACMGTTKLKKSFHIHFDCTITEYIQQVRLGHAEHLLVYTDLPVVQVSKAVGYSNAGRFAELFRQQYGILPMEYRKLSKG